MNEALYKCSFCGKYEEAHGEHFLALGHEVTGKIMQTDHQLCSKCYKVIRKVLKVCATKEAYTQIQKLSLKKLSDRISGPTSTPESQPTKDHSHSQPGQ